MACLRLSFETWVNNEPEEPETDTPTEEQLQKFEESEKQHAELVSDHFLSLLLSHIQLLNAFFLVSLYRTAGISFVPIARCRKT